MSLKLPAANSPVRDLFDMADLAERAAPAVRGQLPTLAQARSQARKAFEYDRANQPRVEWRLRAVTYFVLRANGDLHLITFGPKGGFRIRWNFGQ